MKRSTMAEVPTEPSLDIDPLRRRWQSDTRSNSSYAAAGTFAVFFILTAVSTIKLLILAPLAIFLLWKLIKTIKSIRRTEVYELVFETDRVYWGWVARPETRKHLPLPELKSVSYQVDNNRLFLTTRDDENHGIHLLELTHREAEQLLAFVQHHLPDTTAELEGCSPWDPATRFGDPLAGLTRWTHSCGATNLRSHRLVKRANHYRFVTNLRSTLLWGFATVFSFGAAVLFGSVLFTADSIVGTLSDGIVFYPFFILLGLGVPLLLVSAFGGAVLRQTTLKKFDRRSRVFLWETVSRLRKRRHSIGFDTIHALQLFPAYYGSGESNFTSYQLSLVLKDGSRVPLVNHHAIRKLREETHAIAEMLGVPVWSVDATD